MRPLGAALARTIDRSKSVDVLLGETEVERLAFSHVVGSSLGTARKEARGDRAWSLGGERNNI